MKNVVAVSCWFLVFAAGVCLAQSDSPSLADLARQSREDKKSVKVFSDDDLPAKRATSAPSITDKAAIAASKAETPSQDNAKLDKTANVKTAEPVKGQDPVSEMKKQLDHYTAQRDAWKQAVKRYEELLATDKDPFRRQTYEDALSIDRQNVATYQAKIDELQNALEKSDKDTGKANISSSGSGR